MMSFFASSVTGAALVAAATPFRRKVDWLTDLTIATFFAAYPLLFGMAMLLTEEIRRQTYDGQLYRFDQTLRLDPFVWMRFVVGHPWLYISLMTAYMALPIALALGWLIDRSQTMLRAVAIAPAFAIVLFILVPGVGPIHAFSSDGTLLPLDAIAYSPRNAFPSMHLTWALLIALNARNSKWRIASWTFVIVTGMATICSGEHYYVDLLAALPFSLAVQYAAARFFLISRSSNSPGRVAHASARRSVPESV